MGTFEKFKPRLRAGHILAAENKTVFELEDGSRQVTLPQEASGFLPLMNGLHTLQDIIDRAYRDHHRVPFKALVSTIEKLRSQNCLENEFEAPKSEFETRPEIFDKQSTVWETPLLSFPVVRRWTITDPSPLAFVIFASSSLLLTFASLASYLFTQSQRTIWSSGFLLFDHSYLKGLLFFFAVASSLVSAKALFKALLALVLAGRISNIRLELNVYSFALRLHDEAIYLTGSRAMGALSAATVGLSQFFFFAILRAIAPHWAGLSDVFMVSVLLALVDLNPYRKSELTSFFNVVYNRDAVAHLLPYLKKRSLLAALGRGEKIANETIYTVYSTLAIGWTLIAFNLALALLNRNYSNLTNTIINGPPIEKAAAGVIFLAMLVVSVFLIFDIIRTIARNLYGPIADRRRAAKAQRRDSQGSVARVEDVQSLLPTIAALPLFTGMKADAVRFLAERGMLIDMKPDATIIAQGAASERLYLLLDGSVEVQKNLNTGATQPIATLNAPTAFGENTLLEGRPRGADVIAKTQCRLLSIPRTAFDELNADGEFQSDYDRLFDRLRVGQYIAASELFRDAPSEAIGLFLNQGEILHIDAQKTVIRQGALEKDFYLLVRGEVRVVANGEELSRLKQGDFFGEMALLLNMPRSADVVTTEPATLLKLTAEKFWSVLSAHMSLALFLETVSEMRMTDIESHLRLEAHTQSGVNLSTKLVEEGDHG